MATLVYLAFLMDMLGFLARDELKLRLLMLAGMVFYIFYFFLVTDEPLWDAILTDGILMLINLVMICVVIAERTTWAMTPRTAALSKHFEMLSPGQFRRLLRAGQHSIADTEMTLTTQGAPLARLYYIVSGTASLVKDGSEFPMQPRQFVGEIGFLTGQPASGTVVLAEGGEVLFWEVPDLTRMLERAPALKSSMLAQFNVDLIKKVVNGVPLSTARPKG